MEPLDRVENSKLDLWVKLLFCLLRHLLIEMTVGDIFLESLKAATLEKFDQKKKTPTEPITVTMAFKRYIFDKSMAQ